MGWDGMGERFEGFSPGEELLTYLLLLIMDCHYHLHYYCYLLLPTC